MDGAGDVNLKDIANDLSDLLGAIAAAERGQMMPNCKGEDVDLQSAWTVKGVEFWDDSSIVNQIVKLATGNCRCVGSGFLKPQK